VADRHKPQTLDQCTDQAQELLFLWAAADSDEKRSDFNVGDLTTRRNIGLMPNKHPMAIGVAGEQPPIPIGGTAVNLSRANGHAELSNQLPAYRTRTRRAIPFFRHDVTIFPKGPAPRASHWPNGATGSMRVRRAGAVQSFSAGRDGDEIFVIRELNS
jgi:hypothetical protein